MTENDLRLHLGFPQSDWTLDDAERAEAILSRAASVARAHAGFWNVEQAIDNGDSDKLDVLDAVILSYASRLFANPEAVMQRRQGEGYSVSFADSSEAATGLTRDERATLKHAFALGASSIWIANDVVRHEPLLGG